MLKQLNRLVGVIALIVIMIQCNNAMCQNGNGQPNADDDYTLDNTKSSSTYHKIQDDGNVDNKVYTEVDKKPEFPGGYKALYKFIADHLKYPEAAKMKGIQGKVLVRFIVGKWGYVEDPEIVCSDNPALNSEAIRVVSSLPKWIPGSNKGENVRVSNVIPVTFKLDEQMIANEAPQAPNEDKNEIFLLADKMPVFPGGGIAMLKFIAENIKYPEEAKAKKIQGIVYVNFVVDENGNVVRPKIVRGVDPLLDAEAIRVIKSMPKWQPGFHGEKPVNVSLNVHVAFEL